MKKYEGNLGTLYIEPEVLLLVSKQLMQQCRLLPISLENGVLTCVTSDYRNNFRNLQWLTDAVSDSSPQVKRIVLMECPFDVFVRGYQTHCGEVFTPYTDAEVEADTADVITTEQTLAAHRIIRRAIQQGASDVHITPGAQSATVQFRVNGKLVNSGILLSLDDCETVCNFYKRSCGIEVNNLIPQDGRFDFDGRNIRFSSMPCGVDGRLNKIALRIASVETVIPTLDELGFSGDEQAQLRGIMNRPSGIFLICGPTGEGKTSTQYAMLKELADTGRFVIASFEDPIERTIPGIAQSQVRDAENERNRYTFALGLRSALRQDPNIILIGEIRDSETALTAVQASQTGHMIFSTLHVRNSIGVFRRLTDIGANVSGFAEQVAGIASQRLLSVNCPHCRKRVVSEKNTLLRETDKAMLEEGEYSYVSEGCAKCNYTGIAGRVPVIEIVPFNNALRDYFGNLHGLNETENYLREHLGFKSLWDKGMELVARGDVSVEELVSKIEPDDERATIVAESDFNGIINAINRLSSTLSSITGPDNGETQAEPDSRPTLRRLPFNRKRLIMSLISKGVIRLADKNKPKVPTDTEGLLNFPLAKSTVDRYVNETLRALVLAFFPALKREVAAREKLKGELDKLTGELETTKGELAKARDAQPSAPATADGSEPQRVAELQAKISELEGALREAETAGQSAENKLKEAELARSELETRLAEATAKTQAIEPAGKESDNSNNNTDDGNSNTGNNNTNAGNSSDGNIGTGNSKFQEGGNFGQDGESTETTPETKPAETGPQQTDIPENSDGKDSEKSTDSKQPTSGKGDTKPENTSSAFKQRLNESLAAYIKTYGKAPDRDTYAKLVAAAVGAK